MRVDSSPGGWVGGVLADAPVGQAWASSWTLGPDFRFPQPAQGVDGAKQLAAQRGLVAAVPLEAGAGVERGAVGALGRLGLGDLFKLGHPLFQPLDLLVDHPEDELDRLGLVGRPGDDFAPDHRR